MDDVMRLIDLEPRWISENIFAFRCPCCRNVFLTCKIIPTSCDDQMRIAQSADMEPSGPRYGCVLTKPHASWKISTRDFTSMTVSPSIDASPSGHWHGFIRNGKIV